MNDNLKERAKEILDRYHGLDLESVTPLSALEKLAKVAEEMADVITDFVWDE